MGCEKKCEIESEFKLESQKRCEIESEEIF